jgi:hypothetical protein
MLALVLCLTAPLAVTPLIILLSRHLFAKFVREAAGLFVGVEMHKDWAITLGTPIAIANAIVFTLAWWAVVGLSAMKLTGFSLAAPFIIGLVLAMLLTYVFVKDKLHLQSGPSCLVGLLTFAGGNLPVILLMPMLLMAVSEV